MKTIDYYGIQSFILLVSLLILEYHKNFGFDPDPRWSSSFFSQFELCFTPYS